MAEAVRVEAEVVYSPMVAEPWEYQYNADAFETRGVDEVKQEVGEILRPIFVQFHRNSEH